MKATASQAGAAAHITKPFEPQALIDLVMAAVAPRESRQQRPICNSRNIADQWNRRPLRICCARDRSAVETANGATSAIPLTICWAWKTCCPAKSETARNQFARSFCATKTSKKLPIASFRNSPRR